MMSRFLAAVALALNCLLWPMLAAGDTPASVASAGICFDSAEPAVGFAAAEMREALAATGRQIVERNLDQPAAVGEGLSFILAAGLDDSRRIAARLGLRGLNSQTPQAYALRIASDGPRRTYVVLGADAAGAMYGGLDLAEAVRLGTLEQLTDTDRSPFIARRGIKFNIPLDARTPSYSDSGDAAQHNIPEMWSIDFWRQFLDEMARHRFNVLTLWNLHPFPSLVKVPEYPDVALDDVMRTRVKLDETFDFTGRDMVRPSMLADLETVKRMTIDGKIAFWRDVMQHAHDRGIEVYFFTWNIFVWGAEGKYGITAAQDNPVTLDYFRKSVREMVLTYPLLAGLGITAGEQMQARKDEYSKEKWLWQAYGEGIRDARKVQPDRHVRLIHRYHQTNLGEILSAWQDYPDTFDLSFKYAIAHMYSSPAPPYAPHATPAPPTPLRSWMTERSAAIYSCRWGEPDTAPAFVRNLPGAEQLAGYYMGPDGYIWGREFLSTEPETPRELVISKQWYSFMLWGRLSYDPTIPNEHFERTLAARFPDVSSRTLFEAWCESSRIIPLVTRFHWQDIDLKWFPEACLSHPRHKGFYTVKHFIEGRTMPASGIVNIRDYRDALVAGRDPNGMTPPAVAAELQSHAAAARRLVAQLGTPESKELRLTLGDVTAMAHLGDYYASKILGAVELALYDRTNKTEHQQAAVGHLEAALDHWKQYAAVATRQYRPQLLTRVGYVDLNALKEQVAGDIHIARQWRPAAAATPAVLGD